MILAVLATVTLLTQAPADTVRLRPVIVTATRVPVSPDLISSAVTVLDGAELRNRGLGTLAEALRAIASAVVLESGSFGSQTSLFLRGGESDYVRVLLDGVPLNQPGGALDLAGLTLDNVERIEIVRGPASVLYGSDAVTGVVQIITRSGAGPARFEATARGGRYGTSEFALGAAAGSPRASVALQGSRFSSAGLYAYNNDYRNTVLHGHARLAPDARTEAVVTYRFGDRVFHFPTDGAGRPVDSNQVSTERGPLAGLTLRRALGERVDLRLLGTLRESRIRFLDEPDSPGEDGRFESRDLVRRAGAGAQLDWRARPSMVVTAGVEYEDESQRGRSVFEGSFGSFPDSVDVARWNRALYAQVLLGSARPWAANLGARVEDNSRFGGHVTYRAGLSYRPAPQTRLRASVGTGFKEPTFFENFARGFVRGNPDLAPERSTSWEAGVDHVIGPVSVAATYFHQRFRDLIEFTFTPAPPDSVNYFNVAGADARGAELSLALPLGGTASAHVAYTWLETRVIEGGLDPSADAAFAPGRPLLRRPAHSLAAGLRWSPHDRLSLALDARALGPRDDLDFTRPAGERRVRLGSQTRVDLAGAYTAIRGGPGSVEITARLENALDARDREIANFPIRGRSLFLGARVRLGR